MGTGPKQGTQESQDSQVAAISVQGVIRGRDTLGPVGGSPLGREGTHSPCGRGPPRGQLDRKLRDKGCTFQQTRVSTRPCLSVASGPCAYGLTLQSCFGSLPTHPGCQTHQVTVLTRHGTREGVSTQPLPWAPPTLAFREGLRSWRGAGRR